MIDAYLQLMMTAERAAWLGGGLALMALGAIFLGDFLGGLVGRGRVAGRIIGVAAETRFGHRLYRPVVEIVAAGGELRRLRGDMAGNRLLGLEPGRLVSGRILDPAGAAPEAQAIRLDSAFRLALGLGLVALGGGMTTSFLLAHGGHLAATFMMMMFGAGGIGVLLYRRRQTSSS